MTPNLKAFLDVIAWAEIGPALLTASDNGYNVIVGSTPLYPRLFHDYSDHPRVAVTVRPGLISTAAGRYQILKRNFDHYKRTLNLPDFSPASQDKIALLLILECKAVDDINAGNVESAIRKCRSRWASLPGAGYGQPEKKMADLLRVFERAGGTINQ